MNHPIRGLIINNLQPPKVIGHRGACGYSPENTMASLVKAYELGVKWIEFDVALTKDELPVIMHDEKLNRTTNGKGSLANATYEQIAQLDAGSWFSPEFSGEKVPLFTDFLFAASELNLGINVEIKPTLGMDFETAHSVVQELQNYWPDPTDHLLVSSFSLTSLAVARALDQRLYLALLADTWFPFWQDAVIQLNCISVNASHKILSPSRVAEIKAMGCYVMAYTVDNPIRAKELFSWGVDTVFSNVPDVILAALS